MSPLTDPFRAALRRAVGWPVESQQRARRNAMIACTSLAQRRAQLTEVERFLAAPSSTRSVSEAPPSAAER